MPCWKCECGYKNCDVDECQNPKCKCKTIKQQMHIDKLAGSITNALNASYDSDSDYKNFISER